MPQEGKGSDLLRGLYSPKRSHSPRQRRKQQQEPYADKCGPSDQSLHIRVTPAGQLQRSKPERQQQSRLD